MTTPLDLNGFPSAIYDRHFIEWNRVNNQFNNSISNDLPMFYHNQYSFDFNQFIIDSIHNTTDNYTNYNNPHDCVSFIFEFASNTVNLFKSHPLNIFLHPEYTSLSINYDKEQSTNHNPHGFFGQKYANSSSQLSHYIQDICHKELFLWKNRLSKPKTVINIDTDDDVVISNPTPYPSPTANNIDFNNIFNSALNNIMNFQVDDDNRNIVEGDIDNVECYINDFEVQSVD